MHHMLESVYVIRLNAPTFGISEARTGGINKQLLLSKHTARVEKQLNTIAICYNITFI